MTQRPARAQVAGQMMSRYWSAAEQVFYVGATPWDVDAAMQELGFVQGPFACQDDLGLERVQALHRRYLVPPHPPLLGRMLELGKLGRQVGAGWSRYPGGAGAVDDPIVADLALEEAHFRRLTRTDYEPEEITARVTSAVLGLAVDLVLSGQAEAAEIEDIAGEDLGWPAGLGGPVAMADDMGLSQVVTQLDAFCPEAPQIWCVGLALRQAVALGQERVKR